mgnify:CR=1 FL=1
MASPLPALPARAVDEEAPGRKEAEDITSDANASDANASDANASDADDAPPGSRDRVLTAAPFRERVLDSMFLLEKGDRETVRLLMRGMPLPVTYGFPHTDGGLFTNFDGFMRNFHPLLSVWMVHPLCPFSGRERFVVFVCSVAFNFLWTACTTYNERRVERNVADLLQCQGACFWWVYFIVKHTVTVVDAVLIRQLVICPCLYRPVIELACEEQGWGHETTQELFLRAKKLRHWKVRGDKVILALLLTHLTVIALMIFIITSQNWRHLDDYHRLDEIFLERIVGSELVNFLIWFPKFLPLFLLLFPVHRAMWFTGGSEGDYLRCKRSPFSYLSSENYLDPAFPRCVLPETSALPKNLPYLSPRHGLSNFRRGATVVLDLTSSVRAKSRSFIFSRSSSDASAAPP